MADDSHFEEFVARRNASWAEHRAEMIRWMDGQIAAIAAAGRRHGIPCGKTEGWGEINLLDHPFLGWEWVKECGTICMDLALKHGYRFICTSNFTHPQFPGVWNDVTWHRALTARIRGHEVRGGLLFIVIAPMFGDTFGLLRTVGSADVAVARLRIGIDQRSEVGG